MLVLSRQTLPRRSTTVTETYCEYETDTNEVCGDPETVRVSGTWVRPRTALTDLTTTVKVERVPLCAGHVEVARARFTTLTVEA